MTPYSMVLAVMPTNCPLFKTFSLKMDVNVIIPFIYSSISLGCIPYGKTPIL